MRSSIPWERGQLARKKPQILCLMGPTATGKTQLALELVQKLPCDIISVDSAMVYRGMDIGTAKPTPAEQALAPHRLIDIADPAESYSAGRFYQDAVREIEAILACGRIPLLVGGTMLYFRALQQGLSEIPAADPKIREELANQAIEEGWPSLHAELNRVDPASAAAISPNDGQRIQRALEIYAITGQPRTAWFKDQSKPPYQCINIGLWVEDRVQLQSRVQNRLKAMFKAGFIEEVQRLHQRGDLHADLPALRAVGYQQIWQAVNTGQIHLPNLLNSVTISTMQLAKRQMTWLRRWNNLAQFDCFSGQLSAEILQFLRRAIKI
ncbi:MAG: tRNA (adenosine(37)-N6)-dimethylallyltransferase MiaA [Gammaproteobacteria bacterium]